MKPVSPWKWTALLSAVFAILGVMGLAATLVMHSIQPLMLGILLLVGGVLQLWQSIRVLGWKVKLWHVIIAFLYIGAGLFVLNRPENASGLFATMIAGFLFAIGISRLFIALRKDRSGGSWFTLASGLGALSMGGLLVAKSPVAGLFAVGLFVSIDLLLQAISLFGLARSERLTDRATPLPSM